MRKQRILIVGTILSSDILLAQHLNAKIISEEELKEFKNPYTIENIDLFPQGDVEVLPLVNKHPFDKFINGNKKRKW